MRAFLERISPLTNAAKITDADPGRPGQERPARAGHRVRADRRRGPQERRARSGTSSARTRATASPRRPTRTTSRPSRSCSSAATCWARGDRPDRPAAPRHRASDDGAHAVGRPVCPSVPPPSRPGRVPRGCLSVRDGKPPARDGAMHAPDVMEARGETTAGIPGYCRPGRACSSLSPSIRFPPISSRNPRHRRRSTCRPTIGGFSRLSITSVGSASIFFAHFNFSI